MPKARSAGEGDVAEWSKATGPNTRYRARRPVTLPDGTRKRVAGYGPTKKAAIADREAKIALATAQHPSGTTITVRQFAARWLGHKQHAVTPSTLFDYAKTLRLHVLPHLGDRPLSGLTAMHLQEAVSAAAAKGKLTSADKARKVLKMMYRQALRWELLDRNPAELLEPVLKAPPKRGVWQPDETARFLEHVRARWYGPLYYATLSTGMRRGEVVALRWEDVRGNSLYVNRTYSQVGKDWVMGPPKTRESKRQLPMSESLAALVAGHRVRLEQHAARTRRTWRDEGLVFPSQTGGLLYPPNLRTRLSYYAREAGVPVIRFHDLRRIYATNFIRAGGDPKQLQRRLGHASPHLAMQVYADVADADGDRAVFDLGDFLTAGQHPISNPIRAGSGQSDPGMSADEIDALLASGAADDD